jgi:RNA polymerase sigma-70 factor (ECF subfamily)
VDFQSTACQPCGTDSDEDIIARVLAGEIDLFEVIVRRYSTRIFRVAVSVLRNDAEAEDIVQDTYVSAYQHLSQFAGRAKFSTWLTRIALYKSLAKVSSRNREVGLENEEGQEYPWLVCQGPDPEQSFCRNESVSALNNAIAALPEHYRRVVVMRDIDEIDTASTARELRLSQTNVKVRLHRAHAMLRREFVQALTPQAALSGEESGLAAA